MTSLAKVTSVTNDTTRIRRLPAEYFVDTQRMPRIDLAALLVACGAEEVSVFDILPKRIGYGIPRYRPPTFARAYAALRFNAPQLFATLRTVVLLLWLLRDVEVIRRPALAGTREVEPATVRREPTWTFLGG